MDNRKRFSALTSLKGFFILIVCLHNSMLVNPVFESVPGASFILLFGGHLANSMFFMLSGFLMAYSYRSRISNGQVSFPTFLQKRLQKLYPLFFISNAAALLLAVIQYGASAVNLQKIAFTFLLQNGGGLDDASPYNSPTWFLSALVVCYIVFFFVCFYCRNTTRYSLAIAGGISWGYLLTRLEASVPFCYSGNGIAFMNFFIGCGLAELYPLLERRHRKWKPLAACAALAVCLVLPLKYGVEIICGDVKVAFGFLVCPLILYLALAEGICSRILQWKPFVALGNISMSIFFWHLVVYNAFAVVIFYVMPGTTIQETLYLVYAGLLLVWCIFSYKYLERKMLSCIRTGA